jgi:hypothetical protein
MQTQNKTQTPALETDRTSDYHILIEQSKDVWNAKLEDSQTGEVLEFHRPIDLVRWLERHAKLEQIQTGLT